MKKFETFKGIVAPIDRPNVDTDAIIPKQFKSIKRTDLEITYSMSGDIRQRRAWSKSADRKRMEILY